MKFLLRSHPYDGHVPFARYDEMVRMREKLQKELQTLDEALSLHESEQTDTRDLCAQRASA